jgi:hypothetical protein
MDIYHYEPDTAGFEDAFDRAAEGLADSVTDGLSGVVSEVLDDPIVQALMAADGVDRNSIESLLCRVAAKLPYRETCGSRLR